MVLRARWTPPAGCCRRARRSSIYKNNSDGKGNSYGCHENYLVDRAVPFARIVHVLTPHLVTPPDLHRLRQGGRGGADLGGHAPPSRSQPARRVLRGGSRPRDDAQAADRQHPRRAARRPAEATGASTSSSATRIWPRSRPSSRSATTALVLALIEDDFHAGRGPDPRPPGAGDPAGLARHDSAHDRSSWPTARRCTALEIQWELYDLARKYAEERGLEASATRRSARRVLDRWEAVLTASRPTRRSLAQPARLGRQASSWSRATRTATSSTGTTTALAALDLQYHDLRPRSRCSPA